MAKQKVKTCLWFENNADQAAELYVSLIPGSKITNVARYPEDSPGRKKGDVMTVDFELGGVEYMLLNGGPHFKQSEAASLFVTCENQAEVDRLWDALLAGGGAPSQCGWLKDRWGVSWQIIPRQLMELMSGKDAARSQRVMQAMMQMVKLDVATLERAAAGGAS